MRIDWIILVKNYQMEIFLFQFVYQKMSRQSFLNSDNKQVEIAEFWSDVVELLSSYKELLDVEFAGTLNLEDVILDEFNEQHAMDMELKSYQYGY